MLRQWPWTSQRRVFEVAIADRAVAHRGAASIQPAPIRAISGDRVGDTRGDGSVWYRALLGAVRATATVTR